MIVVLFFLSNTVVNFQSKLTETFVEDVKDASDTQIAFSHPIQKIEKLKQEPNSNTFYSQYVSTSKPVKLSNLARVHWKDTFMSQIKDSKVNMNGIVLEKGKQGNAKGFEQKPEKLKKFLNQNNEKVILIQTNSFTGFDFISETLVSDSNYLMVTKNQLILPIQQSNREVVFCQLNGNAKFFIYSPSHLQNLYVQRKDSMFPFFKDENGKGSFFSEINPFDTKSVDLQSYPLYKEARPITIDLRQNDCFFLPSYWFFTCQMQQDESSKLNGMLIFNYRVHYTPYEQVWSFLRNSKNAPLQM